MPRRIRAILRKRHSLFSRESSSGCPLAVSEVLGEQGHPSDPAGGMRQRRWARSPGQTLALPSGGESEPKATASGPLSEDGCWAEDINLGAKRRWTPVPPPSHTQRGQLRHRDEEPQTRGVSNTHLLSPSPRGWSPRWRCGRGRLPRGRSPGRVDGHLPAMSSRGHPSVRVCDQYFPLRTPIGLD